MKSFELNVRVIPGASRELIVGWHADALKIKTQAPPEGGKANRAVCALVAGASGLGRRSVVVVRGETSKDKVLRIDGLDHDEFCSRIGQPSEGDG